MNSTVRKATAVFIVSSMILSSFAVMAAPIASADNQNQGGDNQQHFNSDNHDNGDNGGNHDNDNGGDNNGHDGNQGHDGNNNGDNHDGHGGGGDICHDGIDNDHDGLIDSQDPDCGGTPPPVVTPPTTGALVVLKVISGGTATPDQFTFSVNGGASTTFNANGENDFFGVAAGTYNILETATTTYTPAYSNCSGVLVVAGATTTCTITNTFVPPTPPAVDLCPNIDGAQATVPDGMTVNSDGNCVTPAAPTTDSGTNGGGSSNNSSGGGGGGSGGGYLPCSNELSGWNPVSGCNNTSGGSGNGGGQVLGASTGDSQCSTPLLTSYLGLGKHNDPDQVKKLQTFLNTQVNAGLTVNGIFDQATADAVKKFQLQYWQDVLSPWKPFGLPDHSPTGYVYKTTLREINNLSCSALNLPIPQLP